MTTMVTQRTYTYQVDLECLMCNRLIDVVTLPSECAPVPLNIAGKRCSACGGQAIRGEALAVDVTPDPPMEAWLAFRTGPGRPPKWLAELRRQQMGLHG